MAVNKDRPHVLVLPEDDANRKLANGFLLNPSVQLRAVQILPNAGGWTKVCANFSSVHALEMERNPERYMVLLVDFDNSSVRLSKVMSIVPPQLVDRVFVLGVLSEPEDLSKSGMGSLEQIGKELAEEC
jgi:hypothetical protein